MKAVLLSMLFLMTAVRTARAEYLTLTDASAVGWNGTTTRLLTKDDMTSWLAHLDDLRGQPGYQLSMGPIVNGGFGFAVAGASTSSISLGTMANAQATFTHPANSETIAESFVYLKDTLSESFVSTSVNTDGLLAELLATAEIDGRIDLSGDARVELGAVVRLTDALGEQFTAAETWTFSDGRTHLFGLGQVGSIGDDVQNSLAITVDGPTAVTLTMPGFDPEFISVEELFYLRAQVGVGGGIGMADADFTHTMKIANIQFFDSNGQVIPGVQLVGANGDVYPYDVVSEPSTGVTPEPTSLALFGIGAFGCSRFARRRRLA